MIDTARIIDKLSDGRPTEVGLGDAPTKEAIREEVLRYKRQGLCGRRIGQQHLGPYFISNDRYGQREIDLLEAVLEEEYADSKLCVRERASECSRLRGGCRRYR